MNSEFGVASARRVSFSSNLINAIVTTNCVICYFDICPEIKTNIAVLVLLMIHCLDFLKLKQSTQYFFWDINVLTEATH